MKIRNFKKRYHLIRLKKVLLRKRKNLEGQIHEQEQEADDLIAKISDLDKQLKDLRQRFYKVFDTKFELDPENTLCPTCKRPVDNMEEKQQKMQEDFNRNKAHKLEKIQMEGKTLKEEKERIEAKANRVQLEVKQSKGQLREVIETIINLPEVKPAKINYQEIPGYQETKEWIDQLQQQYDQPIEAPDLDELKKQKSVLKIRIDQLSGTLSLRDQIQKGNRRTSELEHQQQKLAQEVARLEKIEYTIQRFERAKVEAIEERVNSMFHITRWKLYEQQINGQEVPTCKATFNRVPYPDLNSAAKANVGLDIINTLSRHYGVTAPIFFDNREGVNHLIDTSSQLINLIVTKDPELKIENLEYHGTDKQYTPEATTAH